MNILIKEFFVVFAVSLTLLSVSSNDSPGFFLKVTKNVPRIGRRSGNDYENFFIKASKSVPRIGRRDSYVDSSGSEDELASWFEKFTRATRKVDYSTPKSYNTVRPLDSKHLFDFLSDDINSGSDVKFVSWKSFDEALEKDVELFNKLITMAQDKELEEMLSDLSGKEEITFVPVPGNKDQATFYRTERGQKPIKNNLNKEKIEYRY